MSAKVEESYILAKQAILNHFHLDERNNETSREFYSRVRDLLTKVESADPLLTDLTNTYERAGNSLRIGDDGIIDDQGS